MCCKYWISEDDFYIEEAFSINMNTTRKKEVTHIINQNYKTIIKAWHKHFKQ